MTAMASTAVAKKTRAGYSIEAKECKFVYLRRPHPADPVELCLGAGHDDCTIVKLTPGQVASLAESAVALHFTQRVKA